MLKHKANVVSRKEIKLGIRSVGVSELPLQVAAKNDTMSPPKHQEDLLTSARKEEAAVYYVQSWSAMPALLYSVQGGLGVLP